MPFYLDHDQVLLPHDWVDLCTDKEVFFQWGVWVLVWQAVGAAELAIAQKPCWREPSSAHAGANSLGICKEFHWQTVNVKRRHLKRPPLVG